MTDRRHRRRRALLGVVGVLALSVGAPAAASTVPEDCGGGSIRFVQAESPDIDIIVAVRITDVGVACDGQPIGVQFLGNAEGDPALPATELARVYSDEDPCSGVDDAEGVLVDGAVDISLCEGSSTADFVDGRQLTRVRLITPADAAPVPGGGTPDGAPDPTVPGTPTQPAPDHGLPVTGADAIMLAVLGAAAMSLGAGMVRRVRGTVR